MKFDHNYQYAYGKPTEAGVIRSSEEDFQVVEIPSFNLSGFGEHVYLKIHKVGANTGWVASKLAEFSGIAIGDIGFAGRKDRQAVTEQWFSCYLPGSKEPDWDQLDIEGVTLVHTARHSNKLRKGDLEGNAFELKVREISNPRVLEDRLLSVRDSGVPNYYGEQRFGHNSGNLVYADKLLKGDNSIRRNRNIYLSAARSYMFNHFLSKRMEQGNWDEITVMESGPLYGMSRDPRPGEDSLPPECTDWCNGLQTLRVKSGTRNLKVRPKDLQWRFTEDSVQLSFSLPAGSYATSVLRELLDYRERKRAVPIDGQEE